MDHPGEFKAEAVKQVIERGCSVEEPAERAEKRRKLASSDYVGFTASCLKFFAILFGYVFVGKHLSQL